MEQESLCRDSVRFNRKPNPPGFDQPLRLEPELSLGRPFQTVGVRRSATTLLGEDPSC